MQCHCQTIVLWTNVAINWHGVSMMFIVVSQKLLVVPWYELEILVVPWYEPDNYLVV